MRIAMLSDLHIGREGEDTYGVDVRANFQSALQAIGQRDPDMLIITGDLCYRDPDPAIYLYVREQLDRSGLNYLVIPGNHDHSRMMAHLFGVEALLKDEWLYYRNDLESVRALFIDSSLGAIDKKQLKWLKSQLGRRRRRVFIFMHHPPIQLDVPFMDINHGLRGTKDLLKILIKYKHPIHIFCGHYHVDLSVQYKNLSVHCTPSTFYQIDSEYEDFKVDHYEIGYRLIDVYADRWTQQLRYLQGHPLSSD